MIHNTTWVTAHFHLIWGGAVVIMYFAIAYEMWPRITGKPLWSKAMARWQLWLWFVGMMIATIPWHITGLMGQPRRVAVFDYSIPFLLQWLRSSSYQLSAASSCCVRDPADNRSGLLPNWRTTACRTAAVCARGEPAQNCSRP